MEPNHQTSNGFESRLIQAHLKEAEEFLNNNDLSQACRCFDEALAYEGDYPERAPDIRALLKTYSDQVAEQTSPDWTSAHEALNLIEVLKLDDEQTRTWLNELWRKQAIFHLEKDEFSEGFNAFAELITDDRSPVQLATSKAEIAGIIQDKISQQVERGKWSLLSQMIESFQVVWSPEDELANWLKTISAILDQTQVEVKRLGEELETSALALQRSRMITKIVSVIFLIAAVVYIGILIVA